MRGYKFLVMQTDSNEEHSMFLNSNLGGSGRCCSGEDNITNFHPKDREGSHDNDDYWNSAEELLVGFSRWYNRVNESTDYNMCNRLYYATYTYRFFRIDEDLYDYKSEQDQVDLANRDLTDFEITEREFISNIVGSWAFQQISYMFSETFYTLKRVPAQPVNIEVVLNKEFNTWCWISDYLAKDKEGVEISNVQVPVGYSYDQGVEYISELANCEYRFGGNDAYNKRKLSVD